MIEFFFHFNIEKTNLINNENVGMYKKHMESVFNLQRRYNKMNVKNMSANNCCCLVETHQNTVILETRHMHFAVIVNGHVIFKNYVNQHSGKKQRDQYSNQLCDDVYSVCSNRTLKVNCVTNGTKKFFYNGNEILFHKNQSDYHLPFNFFCFIGIFCTAFLYLCVVLIKKQM